MKASWPSGPEPRGWEPLDGTLPELLRQDPHPLRSLAEGHLAAVVARKSYPAPVCRTIVDRFYELGLLYDPVGRGQPPHRQNIGTVLGWSKDDPEGYFSAAAASSELLSALFADVRDPIRQVYQVLGDLAAGTPVVTASEPDGRAYAPAIVRAYHSDLGHTPHYDRAVDSANHTYAVARVRQQMALVLCLQNADDGADSQPILYEAEGGPTWEPSLEHGTFHAVAAARGVRRLRIELQPGDLYLFRSSSIHEVPPVRGKTARIVVAAFLGLTPDGDRFVVWS
jgi:hypothetical protein